MKYKEDTILEALGGDESLLPSTFTAPVIKDHTVPDTDDYGLESQQVQRLAKQELDFLAALIMPTVFSYNFPDVFKSVWQWLLEYAEQPRAFPQLALGLPRGFGKTTLMKIFVIYCILFTNKKFILVISSTASLAQNILADVMDMLEEPNVKATFGDWKLGVEKDTQQLKKFGFRGRNITLAAVGAEGSLRGLNIKNTRPDVMLFEDIQSRECAESELQSTALETWMIGTAMKAKSPHGCMFLFVANMYPTPHSILRKLKANHTWDKFIAGGILADGTSLWEDLQPIAQLMTEFQNDLESGHPEIFYSEVLNDENTSRNNLIDLSKLPECTYQEGDISAGNYIIIDPATDKINADAVSVGYFEVHGNVQPIMMQLEEGRFSPGETIRVAITMALENNCHLIVVEANSYQYSMLYWFEFICKQMGIAGIECLPIYSGATSKNARILTMFKSYAIGEFFIHPRCKLAAHMQITAFNPLKRDNIDGILDLLTYSPRVLTEFAEFVAGGSIIEQQEFQGIEVQEFNSAF